MQMNGAAKVRKNRNRIGQLTERGDTLVDAADRFRARREAAELERAAAEHEPIWRQVRAVGQSPPRPKAPSGSMPAQAPPDEVVRVLKPRIKLDETQVFILAKDEIVLDENGVRCVPFTVLPAPRDPDDDRRYLTPYILRGWDCVLFCDPDDPDLPCGLQKQADPYEIFLAALDGLPNEEWAAYFRSSGYDAFLAALKDPRIRNWAACLRDSGCKLYHFVPDPLG